MERQIRRSIRVPLHKVAPAPLSGFGNWLAEVCLLTVKGNGGFSCMSVRIADRLLMRTSDGFKSGLSGHSFSGRLKGLVVVVRSTGALGRELSQRPRHHVIFASLLFPPDSPDGGSQLLPVAPLLYTPSPYVPIPKVQPP